ncbi:hypothetical protein C5688_12610, partial [Methylocystis sp. MitZ-2018]
GGGGGDKNHRLLTDKMEIAAQQLLHKNCLTAQIAAPLLRGKCFYSLHIIFRSGAIPNLPKGVRASGGDGESAEPPADVRAKHYCGRSDPRAISMNSSRRRTRRVGRLSVTIGVI